ncbi:hypothetical protein DL796_03380 [Kangiella spongicola]|uniref:Uncharacterized protein n=1 Tax=Kangiella spongicola TaxID=796379 RepID=A0A318D5N1_9GAMM|nr:hypothetical protein DL796_03380 [Kangiella spongicola]
MIAVLLGLLANLSLAADKDNLNNKGPKELAWELAPAKTFDALEAIAQRRSPLDALSLDAKKRFVESVIFTENGVGGFDYRDLELELTATEIYKILSLIGQQHVTPSLKKARIESESDKIIMFGKGPNTPGDGDFLLDYYCFQRGSCESSKNKACTSNC